MKYVISHELPNKNDASVKAHIDIDRFVGELGYKPLTFRTRQGSSNLTRELNRLKSIFKLSKIVTSKDTLLVHYPVYSSDFDTDIFYKKVVKPAGHKICVIHDLPFLRDSFPPKKDIEESEMNRLNLFDQVIVHNESMAKKLKDLGLKPNVIILGIFDYYVEIKNDIELSNNVPNQVIFAGNLNKSKFVTEIKSSKNLEYNLWGNISNKNLIDNSVNYNGVVSSEKLPDYLHDAWGLVWDGTKTDDIEGLGGNYLKYIDPHKASLYIVSGVPIIVWEKAGIAKYIVDNKLGISISSLNEIGEKINNISESEYLEMMQSIKFVGNELVEGKMIKRAIQSAEQLL